MIRLCTDGIVHYKFERLTSVPGLVHAVLTRLGGVSESPYATLNLGHSVGDEPTLVDENQQRALKALGLLPGSQVSPHQVHSARVEAVRGSHTGAVLPATDGLVTNEPNVPLLLRFADCGPLFLFDEDRQAIGLVHVGRRGLIAGVVKSAVDCMVGSYGTDVSMLWAGIGPAIGACCYKVASHDALAVEMACPPGSEVVRREDHDVYVDLPGAIEAQLRAAGVNEIEQAGLCTACHVDEFFSYRAEQGCTGRFGAVIGFIE